MQWDYGELSVFTCGGRGFAYFRGWRFRFEGKYTIDAISSIKCVLYVRDVMGRLGLDTRYPKADCGDIIPA